MRIIKRRITRITPPDMGSTQIDESSKIGSQYNPITQPKFPHTGLVISGTVQTTPEWYESLRKTVETIIDNRIMQTLPELQQMINNMIDAKLQEYQPSGIQTIEYINQLELTKEQVKEIILREINIGQIFYPSDVANKFGLDLITVIDAMQELKNDGKLTDVKTDNVNSS